FLDDAMALLREALRLGPYFALGYYNLSEIAAEGRYRFAPDEIERMKAILSGERPTALERSLCAFALAAVLDKQGSHDEAFGYYAQANDLRKRFNQEHGVVFDAQGHEAMIDRIMADYDQSYFAK